MRFANPIYLLGLIIIPILVVVYNKTKSKSLPTLNYSDIDYIKKFSHKRFTPQYILFILRIIALTFFIIAFARPQAGQKKEEITSKGIDIMLVIDTSSSMKALDFNPLNRLEAAKDVIQKFIKGRKNDRIGVVVFSGISLTQCPLTLDYAAILEFVKQIHIGMTQTDGTAIGEAIITAVNRLKESHAKSKVIILTTDGRNNMGEIDPITASKVAQSFGIKIYTIGAGAPGGALYPIDDPIFGKRLIRLPEELDEVTLKQIAQTTEGLYFRATDLKSLNAIYKTIDRMEKTEVKTQEYVSYTELFHYFLIFGSFIFLIEVVLSKTLLRTLP